MDEVAGIDIKYFPHPPSAGFISVCVHLKIELLQEASSGEGKRNNSKMHTQIFFKLLGMQVAATR